MTTSGEKAHATGSKLTHLEGALSGAMYPADRLTGPDPTDGRPLLARYDLELAAHTLTAESLLRRLWKAFSKLQALGLIGPELPRMVSVQAEGCAPIVRAFENGNRFAEPWEVANTRASGIRVPSAVGDFLILDALRESGGTAVAVDEGSITAMQTFAGRLGAGYVSPESAAALAAVPRAELVILHRATVFAPIGPVRLVSGLREGRQRHEEHHGHEKETNEHHRQESRHRPSYDYRHKPGYLIEHASQRVGSYPRGIVPVYQPDDEGRNRPQKAGN
jgi:hypothetical protein